MPHSHKLLLTAQRLRRLQRDRERRTARWNNFEARVQSAPDSAERGFELALYYAVTQDANSGKQAVAWAVAHPCERRQVALVLDWVGDQISESDRKQLVGAACKPGDGVRGDRDALFLRIATGEDADEVISRSAKSVLASLQSGDWRDGGQLYAAFEYMYTARALQRTDLRQDDPRFFLYFPAALLLSLRPEQVEHPDWQMHVAALALVGIDPNLEASQFLQGWAIGDRQMVREGDGVAYEFLWADPYLPGVGYENLDTWQYEESNNLFARTDWSADACWMHVSRAGIVQENCPAMWQQKTMNFGRLTLIPASGTCVPIPQRRTVDDVLIWKYRPRQTLHITLNKSAATVTADGLGMYKVPGNAEGRVCMER